MLDFNPAASLKANAQFTDEGLSAGGYVDEEIMGWYVSYLAGIKFLQLPAGKGKKSLREETISLEQKLALLRVGGCGALVWKGKAFSFLLQKEYISALVMLEWSCLC